MCYDDSVCRQGWRAVLRQLDSMADGGVTASDRCFCCAFWGSSDMPVADPNF